MAKNNNIGLFIFVVLVVLVLIIISGGKFSLFSAVEFSSFASVDTRITPPYIFDSNWIGLRDYATNPAIGFTLTYEDEFWDMTRISNCENLFNVPSGFDRICSSSNIIKDGESIIMNTNAPRGATSSSFTRIYKPNVKGKDISIQAKGFGCRVVGSGGFSSIGSSTIMIGNEPIDLTGVCTLSNQFTTSKNIQIVSDRFDANVADLKVDGVFLKTLDFSNLDVVNVVFKSHGLQSLNQIFFGVRDRFGCQQSNDEFLGMQTFVGQIEIGQFDFGLGIPKKFCEDQCPLLTDNAGGGSTTIGTCSAYRKWSEGRTVSIPEGSTLTAFAIFQNDGSIPGTDCPDRYDIEKKTCVSLVKFCGGSEIWDSSKGTCVPVFTERDRVECGQFQRYDIIEDRCVLNIPQRGVCEVGDYSTLSGKCEHDPIDGKCFPRYELNNNVCQADPLAFIACNLGLFFNSTSGFCQNSNSTIIEPVLTDITTVCDLINGEIVRDSSGNPVCISVPREPNVIIEKEFQIIQEFIIKEKIVEKIVIVAEQDVGVINLSKITINQLLIGILIFIIGVLIIRSLTK